MNRKIVISFEIQEMFLSPCAIPSIAVNWCFGHCQGHWAMVELIDSVQWSAFQYSVVQDRVQSVLLNFLYINYELSALQCIEV